jgi:hypoxanthine phosphoribosyltransferase
MDLHYDISKLKLMFDRERIRKRVDEMGGEITAHYKGLLADGDMLLVIGILNGAFMFMADLIRAIGVPLEIDFIRLSSYEDHLSSSSKVVMLKNFEREVKNRHVLVVEDIADCGLTLAWLVEHLKAQSPASVRLAVAVDKSARREVRVDLDHVGFRIEDGYLVGYGLDAAKRYREFPDIYSLD